MFHNGLVDAVDSSDIDVVEFASRIVAWIALLGRFTDITNGSDAPFHHERSTFTNSPRTCSSNASTSKIAPSRSIGLVPESALTQRNSTAYGV